MSSKILSALAVLLSAAAGVAIGVILHVKKPWLLLVDDSAAKPAAQSPAASSSASAGSFPSPSATAATGSAAAAPTGSASAGGPPDGPAACMRSLFSDDTFENPEPDLAKLCADKTPSKYSKRVKELLVGASHGRMTGGMKEWGILGIYQLAAMAAMRGHCCPDAPPLEVAGPPGTCAPLTTSLDAINSASRGSSGAADLDAAVATFDKDVRCVIRSEQTQAFGDYGPLGGGEGTTLDKTIRRIRPAASGN